MKTAIIGLGRIGWNFHLQEVLAHSEFSLCAVVDVNKERLSEARDLYGVNTYEDHNDMLNNEHPDLVIIASPTHFHKQQAIDCLRFGADVLMDKPLTIDYQSALEIQKVKNETGRKLTVYQPHRFLAPANVAKRIINSGVLGEVYQISRSNCNFVHRNDWQAYLEFGGGMLFNYGAHFIDQLMYLSGSKIEKQFCQMQKILSLGDAEDVVKLVLKTENDIILNIDINQATVFSLPEMMLFGNLGTATLERSTDGSQFFRVKYYSSVNQPEMTASRELCASNREYPSETIDWSEDIIPLTSSDATDYYKLCADYFCDKGTAPVPFEETMEVMRILDECRNNSF